MSILKYRIWYFVLSLIVIVPGVVSLFLYGLKPSIDFVGGSLLEVQFASEVSLPSERARELLGDRYQLESVQQSGEQQFILKGETIDNDQKNAVLEQLAQVGEVSELRFESVGPTLSRELLVKMLTAVGLVAVMITLYIWKQFSELRYGVCAILAMVHDSLVLLGIFSLLGYYYGVEVDVLFVTAVLTTLSFSVHDTIVVYDRIRELRRKHPRASYETILDAAVLETLARSVNNSVTIILMLLALTLLGGESIRLFALALLVGAVTGTYSSAFTSVPLLSLWEDFKQRRKAVRPAAAGRA
jgi:preprotein translocase subunit SecF